MKLKVMNVTFKFFLSKQFRIPIGPSVNGGELDTSVAE